MKKVKTYLLFSILFFGILGCEDSSSSDEIGNQDENSIETNLDKETEKEEFPSDFEIVNITKSEYNDKGGYELHFDLKNNSTETFSTVWLDAVIKYVLPDGESCEAIFQKGHWSDIKPKFSENWLPNTVIKHTMVEPVHKGDGGCSVDINRTPKSIILEIKIGAISVDREINDEILEVYDLLPLWKEKQTSLGLR